MNELTGLPELPEGYFWRIGEKDINSGWYDNKPCMRSAVFIMREAQYEQKVTYTNVYGTFWYNKNIIVEKIPHTYMELGEPKEVFSQTYDDIRLSNKKELPEFGQIVGRSINSNGKEYAWTYSVPIGTIGTIYIANLLKAQFDEYEDYRVRQEIFNKELDKTKEELYGDYPPKTLNKKEN